MDGLTDTQLTYNPRITDLPAQDRPRERLLQVGANGLHNAELLAILLRIGVAGENAVRVAERLLAQLGGLPGLHRASYTDLCSVKGIGPAKAAQLMARSNWGGASPSPRRRSARRLIPRRTRPTC